jgi:multicomponent Na+:H+ antiporter subunit G
MEFLSQVIAVFAVLAGTAFSVLGVLGYIRMPDVYTRLHATAKVGVFGGVLLLVATIFWTPFSVGKGFILIAYLLLTGPVTSHALGSAAYRIGIPLKRPVRDDLAQRVTSPGSRT